MRARVRLSSVIVAVFTCSAGVAYAGPGDVYNDFAADGTLSCNHSRADLQAVLRSGSINQYGDPYTLARLKLAIRRQLAGGCRGERNSRRSDGTKVSEGANGTQTTPHAQAGSSSRKNRPTRRNPPDRSRGSSGAGASAAAAVPGTEDGTFVWERTLVGGLLVGGLAIGGWLTRRALAARN